MFVSLGFAALLGFWSVRFVLSGFFMHAVLGCLGVMRYSFEDSGFWYFNFGSAFTGVSGFWAFCFTGWFLLAILVLV